MLPQQPFAAAKAPAEAASKPAAKVILTSFDFMGSSFQFEKIARSRATFQSGGTRMSRYGNGNTLPGSAIRTMPLSTAPQLARTGGGAIAGAPDAQPMSMHCSEQCWSGQQSCGERGMAAAPVRRDIARISSRIAFMLRF